jgi:hypothetical protein
MASVMVIPLKLGKSFSANKQNYYYHHHHQYHYHTFTITNRLYWMKQEQQIARNKQLQRYMYKITVLYETCLTVATKIRVS